VHAIQRRGAQVHVWTVNDPRTALSMVEMGVDNIITDRPADLRNLLEDWRELSDSERITLMLRRLLFPDEELAVREL